MNIKIITLSMSSIEFGRFYNAQDKGLGKALAKLGNEVDIYNFVKDKEDVSEELTPNCKMHYVASKSIGYHSINKLAFITKETDCVICFSDNQLLFRYVVKKCNKLGVKCFPYVGVLGSNNDSGIKSVIMNKIANNINIYKKMTVLAKTPDILNKMINCGIKDVVLCPVCLDEDNLFKNFEQYHSSVCKDMLGFSKQDKIILFVGRLNNEKNPLQMIEIFAKVAEQDNNLRLVMVSSGHLLQDVLQKVKELQLEDKVTIIPKVENSEIWKYYRAAEAFVNLNTHEIFGMSILESMYYKCPIIAAHAPGPDFIIEGSANGILCNNPEEVMSAILNDSVKNEERLESAHKRVCENFLWKSTAQLLYSMI